MGFGGHTPSIDSLRQITASRYAPPRGALLLSVLPPGSGVGGCPFPVMGSGEQLGLPPHPPRGRSHRTPAGLQRSSYAHLPGGALGALVVPAPARNRLCPRCAASRPDGSCRGSARHLAARPQTVRQRACDRCPFRPQLIAPRSFLAEAAAGASGHTQTKQRACAIAVLSELARVPSPTGDDMVQDVRAGLRCTLVGTRGRARPIFSFELPSPGSLPPLPQGRGGGPRRMAPSDAVAPMSVRKRAREQAVRCSAMLEAAALRFDDIVEGQIGEAVVLPDLVALSVFGSNLPRRPMACCRASRRSSPIHWIPARAHSRSSRACCSASHGWQPWSRPRSRRRQRASGRHCPHATLAAEPTSSRHGLPISRPSPGRSTPRASRSTACLFTGNGSTPACTGCRTSGQGSSATSSSPCRHTPSRRWGSRFLGSARTASAAAARWNCSTATPPGRRSRRFSDTAARRLCART
jgi:hypothetical protein